MAHIRRDTGYKEALTRVIISAKKYIQQINWLFFALAAVAAVASLSPVLRHTGWPLNHDLADSMFRTDVYAAHFRHGDLLPIWSSSDAFGLGSPMPLYYQRLFYTISGLADVITGGHVKVSIVITLFLFSMLGIYGMRRCVQVLSSNRLLNCVVPVAFIFTNYSFTDWLVRGDLAEFSAMMLVPWVLWWCLRLLKDKQISYALIPIMVAMLLAHNAIAMLVSIVILIALVIYLASNKQDLKVVVRKMTASAAATVIVLSPIFIAQLFFSRYYDPQTKITQDGYSPGNNFAHWTKYFYNSTYHWLRIWTTLTPQIDFGITIGAIGFIFLSIFYVRTGKHKKEVHQNRQVALFLFSSLLLYLLLQFPFSEVIYTTLKPLSLIQFPWRMLSIITPLGLLISALFFEMLELRQHRLTTVLVWLWLASFILLSPVLASFHYRFMPPAKYDGPRTGMLYKDALFIEAGEYLPKTYWPNGEEYDLYKMNETYAYMYTSSNLYTYSPANADCTMKQLPTAFESASATYQFFCQTNAQIALPVSYSNFLRIYTVSSNGTRTPLPFAKQKTEPRALVIVPGKQEVRIEIVFPTIIHVLVTPIATRLHI